MLSYLFTASKPDKSLMFVQEINKSKVQIIKTLIVYLHSVPM